jgi:PAS domain S-box-containing protein
VKSVDLNLKRYTVKEGLVQSQVYTITQSPDGYLWIGTAAGLSRFDGKKFKTYYRRDGLGGNVIKCSTLDKDGNVWFGHYSGKLSKYNWKTKIITTVELTDSNVFRIISLKEDSKGNLWVATNNRGIYLNINGRWHNFTIDDGLNSNYVNDLERLENGYMVASFSKGLLRLRYDVQKGNLEIKKLTNENLLKDYFIYDVDVDLKNNTIWAATGAKGLIKFSYNRQKDTYSYIQYTAERGLRIQSIKKVKVAPDSKLWIALRNNGVLVADLNQGSDKLKFVKYLRNDLCISNNRVYDFFVDRENNMWIGTNGTGLFQYKNTNIRMMAYNLDSPVTSVWSFLEDRNKRIWIGIEGLIAVATINNLGIEKIDYLNNLNMGNMGKKQVIVIKEDKNGDIYYTSWGNGVFKINPKTLISQKFIPYKGFPQGIVKSLAFTDDDIWFVTEGSGIIRYNKKSGAAKVYTVFADGIKINRFFDIYKDQKGKLWFASFSQGVVSYDGKKFSVHNKRNGFPLKSVFSFANDPWDNVWFISYSGELAKFDGRKFTDYSFAKGIEGQPVYSAISDDSTFWVSTPEGILRFEPSDSSFSNYFSVNGFQISETNTGAAFCDSRKNIWFGMVDGILQLKPEIKKIAPFSLPLFINKVQVFFKDTPFPENNKYDYGSNNLTFYYQAVSLVNPERVRYSYLLEGYDKKWSPPFIENKATYSNLPPGEYTFKVKACDSYGRWINKAVVYHFEILTPFWRSWLFYLLIVFSVIFSAVFIYNRRVARLEKYNLELEEEVQKRVSELSGEKEKVEFAFNALRESEKKFRIFTETTESSIFIMKNGKINYINPAGEKLSGYNESELIDLNVLKLIHSDFVDQIKEYLANGFESQDLLKLEIKIINKNGDHKWIDLIIKPIVYNNENVFLGTAVNISERKIAEERLLEEKERLSVTLSSITDAVVTTDTDGNIVLMNPVAEKISGYLYKDAVGKNINDVFILKDEHSDKSNLNLFDKSLKNMEERTLEAEAVVVKDNRQKMYIEYTSSLVHSSKGEISGLVFVLRDISERKKMIGEFLKAKKLESLGVLAGGIAHDFNNILTAIIGNLSLAKMKIDAQSEAYKWIDLSEKSSFRAKGLTQQLLTFSKGGRPIKDNAPIDKLIKDTTSFILSGSNVECKVNFDENLPYVNMDSGQISQVIQNLIINAQQSMPDGGTIAVDVASCELQKSTKQPLDDGVYVEIKISDKGTGIPAEYLDKIFDPFFTTRDEGSGLGLSTAYSIINNHNGSISVESSPGKGTTFTVILPAVAVAEKKSKDKDVNINHGKGRILIMDDEELVLDTAAAMLEFLGYRVGKVINGEEALKIYQQEMGEDAFSAVIMDLTIPGGMGGKDAVREILKIDPDATVIVSSGYSNDPVMADYEKYGFKKRIQKPYNLKELSELLKSLEFSKKLSA